MKHIFIFILAFTLGIAFNVSSNAEELELIKGSGTSTKIVALFAQELSKKSVARGFKLGVPAKSTKHAGGVKNSDEFIFGRIGRPLNDKERALNKREIFLARVPIAFVVGKKTGVNSINVKQLEGIMTGKITKWSEVGGADENINVIGREPTESFFSVLKENQSFFNRCKFDQVVKKDNHVVNILKSKHGDYSIGFGALPNFKGLNILNIENFSEGVSVGLVYDLKNKNHPLVKKAQEMASSAKWAEKVMTLDVLPPN
jgi:ABC-type phosphate transport system substrate-binding protein